jgi:hypothetical protein
MLVCIHAFMHACMPAGKSREIVPGISKANLARMISTDEHASNDLVVE